MTRVSDALRRAGHDESEAAQNLPDGTAFQPGEEGVVPPDPPPPVSSDPPRAAEPEIAGTLVARPLPMPAHPRPIRIDRPRSGLEEDVRLHDVLRMLGRHRWLIAAVVIFSLLAAEAYNRTVVPVFEATSSVVIEPTPSTVGGFRTSAEDPGRFDYYVTQLDVLRSRALGLKTLERLNQQSPGARLAPEQVGTITGSLTITPRRGDLGESRVVSIKARSTDPKRAALIANVHAQTYVDHNLENLKRGSRQASEWLNARLAELRREVSSTQGALQAYREKQDAVSLEDRQNIVAANLLQLNTAVTTAQTELVDKGALYQQLTALEERGAPLDTYPPILANASLLAIKNELEGLKQKRLQLGGLGELHPDMEQINLDIANQERRLAAETAKVVEGIKTDYRAVQKKVQGLSSALERQKGEVLELNRKSIGYSALQRDANSIQQIFDLVMTRLKEMEISGELPSSNIHVLDHAEVPTKAVTPRVWLNLGLALMAGTFLGIGLVFAVELLHPRLVDPHDISASLGLPLLGTAPRVSKFGSGPANIDQVPASFQEAIRHIRAQIFLAESSSAVRTLAVTSARPGEGKTVLAASLATSTALGGRRVLLVDGDLRRAQLARMFRAPRAPGLSNVLAGEIKPSEALVETPIKGLYVLPAGDERPNPGDLLDGVRLNRLIASLRKVFDVVVIDCPPVMAVADAAIVASAATSVVFVIKAGHTSREVAQQAVDRLEAVQARVLGVVLNNAKSAVPADYYYAGYSRKKDVRTA